jgi:hypothetical protein
MRQVHVATIPGGTSSRLTFLRLIVAVRRPLWEGNNAICSHSTLFRAAATPTLPRFRGTTVFR